MSNMVRKELKKLLPLMLLLDALCFGISAIFMGFRLPMLLGLLLGTAAEVLNLILLGNAVRRAVLKPLRQAKASMGVSYAGRSLMIVGVIVFAYLCRQAVDPVGTALPFLFPKLIYLVESIFIKERRGKDG